MKKIIKYLCLFTLVTLVGCASVPMANIEQDSQAKDFIPVANMSTIYVYRNENFGAAIKMPLLIDDKFIGDTAANTYLRKVIEPGRHTLVSKTENDAELQIDAEPGRIYYVWQEVKMGMFTAGSKLHLVDEAVGKKGVLECKLIE
jgi:hypothetical protein